MVRQKKCNGGHVVDVHVLSGAAELRRGTKLAISTGNFSWVISHVPIFHITQPLDSMIGIWSTRWLLFQVMSNIPKMGQLTTPVFCPEKLQKKNMGTFGLTPASKVVPGCDATVQRGNCEGYPLVNIQKAIENDHL